MPHPLRCPLGELPDRGLDTDHREAVSIVRGVVVQKVSITPAPPEDRSGQTHGEGTGVLVGHLQDAAVDRQRRHVKGDEQGLQHFQRRCSVRVEVGLMPLGDD